jgi:hypothetical protein
MEELMTLKDKRNALASATRMHTSTATHASSEGIDSEVKISEIFL